jgi:hypothetical protein
MKTSPVRHDPIEVNLNDDKTVESGTEILTNLKIPSKVNEEYENLQEVSLDDNPELAKS